jgi:HK97 family phage major capsid protein
MSDLATLLRDVHELRDAIASTETNRSKSLTELKSEFGTRIDTLADGLNEIFKRLNRPTGIGNGFTPDVNRKSALALLELKHQILNPQRDPHRLPTFTEDQIKESETACRAISNALHATDIGLLPDIERKALSSFTLGQSGFMLRPEQSSQILSCLTDETDVSALVANMNISAGSIEFLVDNVEFDRAGWACETNCFANNPQANISGLGTLEIKAESLRYIVCATRSLLEDASTNVEAWAFGKVARAFRATISESIIGGDGNGKPLGILTPQAGIPIFDTSENTPAGTFAWQDIVALIFQVPIQYHGRDASLWMNQRTAGLLFTMSDATGRPIMTIDMSQAPAMRVLGVPVVLNSFMPDALPGNTPIAFGDWRSVYQLVTRRAIGFQHDPFSSGWCSLFKFDARIGGAVKCPNAARLLRIN